MYFHYRKKTPVKRKAAPVVKPIIKKKSPRKLAHGNRRSLRLALKQDSDEEESTDDEVMDVS